MKASPTTYTFVSSPIGALCLTFDGDAISGLYTDAQKHGPVDLDRWTEDASRFGDATRELSEYFAGTRRTFSLPLEPRKGTPFQRDVWKALRSIAYGDTVTYGDIARRIGRPGAVRAVGVAIGNNPWGILVPCHRVVGANGALTGFAGGIARKRWLLEHEGVRVHGGADRDDPRAVAS